MKHTVLLLCALLAAAAFSCAPHSTSGTFDPMVGCVGDTVVMEMDLANAVIDGVVLPSGGKSFHFVFDTVSAEQLYYKIYYQNESYAFGPDDSLNYENFYGSWEDVSIGFKPVPASGHIADSFRIVGNPRDERIYYGADLSHYDCSQQAIDAVEREIRADTNWFRYVSQVAAPQNNRTLEEQLFLDTRWVLNARKHEGGNVNHRWKRNPRTGCYSFLLVVCDAKGLAQIPECVQHIGLTDADSHYVNPCAWFHNHPSRHISLLGGTKTLRTFARLTPQNGVYVDELQIRKPYESKYEEQGRVGSDTALYRHALFQQFFPAVSQQYTLRNIPLVADIENYCLDDYLAAPSRYDSAALVYDYPQITSRPGSTVKPAADGSYLSIVNPGNATLRHPVKESTGVKTRVGFSYGRYRGKIKFPPMLNRCNVWNGLTYAFWLIYQDEDGWNMRRPSYHGGYLDKNDESPNPDYHLRDKYSEIDIEIVKASPRWPATYYHGRAGRPDEDAATTGSDVVFACTNWDLACPEPRKFSSGITRIPYEGTKYEALRWYDTYKALTTKTAIPNAIFDADYYYYEIEWKPTEIIWRLGPDPQHMRVVGYMSDRYTAIPDNQMLAIVTQEWHYSEWWPPVVYEQGRIPFNASDIEGRVYEIVVE